MTTVEQARALQAETEQLIMQAVDAKAIGFMEVGVAARLAAQVRSGHGLTTEQARQAWRILRRNEGRLNEKGLRMPATTAVATPPVAATPPANDAGRPRLAMRSDGRIAVTGQPFALREALKNEAHATWDMARKQWHASATPAYAAALATILAPHNPLLSAKVTALVEEYAARAQHRAALDPAAPVPDLDLSPLVHGDLWEHQIRATAYASSVSAAMLAVQMGGGKTAAAVATVNRVNANRVVIVCPNKVRGVWPREVRRWSRRTWHMVDGKRPSRHRGGRAQDLSMAERLEQAESCLFDCACGAQTHAVVFNYEMLVHEPISSWSPPVQLDMVIYDEAHRLKSPTGQMSRTAGRWVDFFQRRLGLTGTPMPQFPWDIFGIYRALDPGIFGAIWTPFKAEFVREGERKDDGRKFPVAIVDDKRREFARRVHSIMYRPTVDLGLPGALHTIRPVELEPAARREYDRLDEQMWADLSTFASGDGETLLTPANVLARRVRLRQLTGGTLPDDGERQDDGKLKRTKHRVSTAKVDELAEVLDEMGCVAGRADGPEPVCVYTAFLDDLDMIRGLAEASGLRYGEISGRRGDGLDDQSQMAGGIDVCGVQIQSGGTGVDLTRSCVGVFYSVDYKVGDHDQALKRQDRPGQKRVVTFVHLVAEKTIDVDVYRSLASRRSIVATFLASRGLSPALVGLSDEDAAPELSLEEVQDQFNRDRAAEGTDAGRSGGTRMPIDDYAEDVWGDPRGARRKGRPAVSEEKLREFGLEDW